MCALRSRAAAHAKHTEGGDFRQATYRAIRQGLMQACEAGAVVLLEPWYHFELEVPGSAWAGRCQTPRAWVPVRAADDGGETGRSLGSRAGIRGAGLCVGGGCLHERSRIICTSSLPGMLPAMMPSA